MAITYDNKAADPRSAPSALAHRREERRQGLIALATVGPAVVLIEVIYYVATGWLGWQGPARSVVAAAISIATIIGLIAGIFNSQTRQTIWQALPPIILGQAILVIGDGIAGLFNPLKASQCAGVGAGSILCVLAEIGSSQVLVTVVLFLAVMFASIIAGAFHRPEGRQIIWQAMLIVFLSLFIEMIVVNTALNLKKANIASGFDFYRDTSKFDIAQSLIEFTAESTYARAFWVGLLNTVLVAGIGIVLATAVGFIMGIARLSTNWLIARLATAYVEIARNLPLLLQLFVWYIGVLKALAEVGDSKSLSWGGLVQVIFTAILIVTAVFTAIGASSGLLRMTNVTSRLEGAAQFIARVVAGVGIYIAIMLAGMVLARLFTGLPVGLKSGIGTLFLPVLDFGVTAAPAENFEGSVAILNNRGLYVARPQFEYGVEMMTRLVEPSKWELFSLQIGQMFSWLPPFSWPTGLKKIGPAGHEWLFVAFLVAIVIWAIVSRVSRKLQEQTGKRLPSGWIGLGLIFGLPLIAYFIVGRPITMSYPKLDGFNFSGGLEVIPEFLALLLGLVFYTGSYIAEIVRAGVMGVARGQREAGLALGLPNPQVLRLVVIPQALRIIIPPLTSQYLNLTKNSSLAVAIAYPDLVSVFAGTVLNQTGQAVEMILVTMLVYLTTSLTTSMIMNWYNWKKQLVER